MFLSELLLTTPNANAWTSLIQRTETTMTSSLEHGCANLLGKVKHLQMDSWHQKPGKSFQNTSSLLETRNNKRFSLETWVREVKRNVFIFMVQIKHLLVGYRASTAILSCVNDMFVYQFLLVRSLWQQRFILAKCCFFFLISPLLITLPH